MRSHTTHTRDAALRQLQRLNRWMIAGSVVLTGVLADVAANAFPGKTIKHTTAPSATKTGSTNSSSGSKKTSTGVLRAPTQAPKSSESESAPAEAQAPARESAPAQEAAPSQEAAPAEQAAPAQEATPRESTPTQQAAPEPQASAPVVSGGS